MLLLALLGAASLGGWFVVAPALATREAVRVAPPIDLDEQAIAAAAPASAARPSAAPRASNPASSAHGGSDEAARCGDDQRAAYADPAPDAEDGSIHFELPTPDPDGVVRRQPGEVRAAGVGYTGAMARIDAALRASADPFDRAMADWLDLNRLMPPPQRLAALVQDALATSDARVYGLAYEACNDWVVAPLAASLTASAGCSRLSAADWARRDPGNARPLLWVLSEADQRGDAVAQRDAMERLASASRLDSQFHDGSAAVARLRMSDVDLAAQLDASMRGVVMPHPQFSAVTQRCRRHAGGDAALAATCARIATTLFEHSDDLLGRAIGGSIHRLVTDDASWLDRAHRDMAAASPGWVPKALEGPCGEQRGMLKLYVRMAAVGELKAAQEAQLAASAPTR